jgi:nicotinate-nucleotide pyrophosphorylase (carboxylating)
VSSGELEQAFAGVVATALAEDVGAGDATTEAIVPPGLRGSAVIVQRAPGVIFGLEGAEAVFAALSEEVRCTREVQEGCWREQGGPVLALEGPVRALLTGERTALNLLGHLSGVATAAARAMRAVEGTRALVVDTRKTTPGLRVLEKAAVRAGGAGNHRRGLDDAILIKDNHIAAAGSITRAIARVRERRPDLAASLEVEVRNGAELEEALACGAPRILLDNMSDEEVREAVARSAGRALLEASGSVRDERLRSLAQTGVDWISMGYLTHSAPSLDLSMKLND